MKKAAGKGTATRKKKVTALPARSARTSDVKGGGFSSGIIKSIGKPISPVIKSGGA
jgi:hypothetical protein